MNIDKLTDPHEFSEYYYQKLKEKLNVTDLNLNKLGFVGFFIEMLGNVQYDVKQYYDNLFNEAFPVSARNNLNLLYHSNVYGFKPKLAVPSQVIGRFKINDSLMNVTGVHKREVHFDNINFKINDLLFNVDSFYRLVYTKTDNSYFIMNIEIMNGDSYDIVPVLTSNSTVNTVGVLQYSESRYKFTVPRYSYGSYHIHNIQLSDYLYDLTVEIENEEGNVIEQVQMYYSKLYSNDNSDDLKRKIAFYSISSNNELELTFGSGLIGTYLPNTNIRVSVKTTKGNKGNVNKHINKNVNGSLLIFDYDQDNKLLSKNTVAASGYISVDIDSSMGGADPYVEDDLQANLLKYIQTRENLVSSTDFHNNVNTKLKYSEILFKKSNISENVIYLYTIIENKYLNPVYTLTTPVLTSVINEQLYFNNNKQYLVLPEIELYDNTYVCPFYFEYNESFSTYDGFAFLKEINIFPAAMPVLDITSNVKLPNDLFLNLIYDQNDDSTTIYVKTKTNFFIDDDIFVRVFISSRLLNLANIELTLENDYFYFKYEHGIISTPITIYIDMQIIDINGTANNYNYRFDNVQNTFKEADNLRFKTYYDNQHEYLIGLPFIDKNEYTRDIVYYSHLIKEFFKDIQLKENRMISDEVQFRFLNTYICESKYNEHLFKQDYNNDIYLPFKLEMRLTFSKHEVVTNNLNINNVINNVYMEISKFLLENTTGTKLKFYKSKLVDIAFNFEGIKAVHVVLKDYRDTEINIDGLETNNKEYFLEKIDKKLYLEYSPIFWWFDLNNIKFETVIL